MAKMKTGRSNKICPKGKAWAKNKLIHGRQLTLV